MQGERVSFWWTMGVNQSHQGVRTAQAIINLALMTGNIGRPGTGANSITGQCNAMGSRLFSNTTNLLGGHDFANPAHRRKVADALRIAESDIPTEKSWPYHKILEGILSGKIRGLWVIGTNPAHSWINQGQLRDILDRLDFLVVQDMYASTETAQLADLVLPAAAWGEKDGTFINSERRIGIGEESQPRARDWRWPILPSSSSSPSIGAAARCFASGKLPRRSFRSSSGFPRDNRVISRASRILKCWTRAAAFNGPIRFEETARSRSADFSRTDVFSIPTARRVSFGPSRNRFPRRPTLATHFFCSPAVVLPRNGIRKRARAKSEVLKKLYPADVYVELNPRDAGELKIRSGDWVTVSSQRGNLQAKAVVVRSVPPRQVFVPMHYGSDKSIDGCGLRSALVPAGIQGMCRAD